MIDDPDPASPRRWPRPDPSAPSSSVPGRPTVPAGPVGSDRPAEPGWGDPFASYATLSDVDAARAPDAAHDGWAAAAPDVGAVRPATSTEPSVTSMPAGPGDAAAGTRRSRGDGPLVLTLLRPWFEPRPGELRGVIVVLSVALAVSLALWFDASRRPQAPDDARGPAGAASDDRQPAPAPGAAPGTAPGRVDGSDGWGLPATSTAPRGPVVHVSGAVGRPGVVTVPERSRVADAIAAVGGAMPDARLDRLNLARIVEDGERIHVPRVGEDAPPPEGPASRGLLADGRIDLNAASQAELETLPGVGPARAQAIIAERETRPFRVPGDLRRVPGIGEATFQRLAPLVAVR